VQRRIRAEEMSLRDLRKARKLTQARVAKALGVTQDSVSRLEKRSDLLLSTLRKTVKAMGGDVRIIAEFRTVHRLCYPSCLMTFGRASRHEDGAGKQIGKEACSSEESVGQRGSKATSTPRPRLWEASRGAPSVFL